MATISSHILDSVRGTHADGIRCQLLRLGDSPGIVFDTRADAEGRIAERIEVDAGEFELVVYGAEYFAARGIECAGPVEKVVIRFVVNDPERRYHLPIMLSPHSYSTWWSG